MDCITEHETIRQEASAWDRLLTATDLGVHPSAMTRLANEGILRRIVAGVYIGAMHPTHGLIEAAAWTLRHPEAVTGLLTAAIHHGLTDAFARGTWLFVPLGSSPPRSRVVGVHVVQTAPRFVDPAADATHGIQTLTVHGVDVRVTDPDRTTLDLWRYPRRISREYALDGLRRRVLGAGFEMPRFARLGRELGVWSKVEPIVQGLVLR